MQKNKGTWPKLVNLNPVVVNVVIKTTVLFLPGSLRLCQVGFYFDKIQILAKSEVLPLVGSFQSIRLICPIINYTLGRRQVILENYLVKAGFNC